MPRKIKYTRPELKRQRDALARFERYLPTLKLKQQQLQMTLREVRKKLRQAEDEVRRAEERFNAYRRILADRAGVDVQAAAEPEEVRTSTANVAGVRVPVFEEVTFQAPTYSLFATPAWVDRALSDLRDRNRLRAQARVLRERFERLNRELTKIMQRVNLFEKVKIPETRDNIRRIRIQLGDAMTAAVCRAKIAKEKLSEPGTPVAAGAGAAEEAGAS
ncbi:MAG: V-type ATP synthase subunit D [Phycisphaerae bacterium]